MESFDLGLTEQTLFSQIRVTTDHFTCSHLHSRSKIVVFLPHYLLSPVYQAFFSSSSVSLWLIFAFVFLLFLCDFVVKPHLHLSCCKPRQIQIAQIRPTGFAGQIAQLHRHTRMIIVGNPH